MIKEANKMEDEPSLEYDTGGRWQCDDCELVFEVYGMQDVDDVKRCPICGSYNIWIVEEMDL
ncbi:zinc ribbon domain-containing protein [Ligilactobacillus salivarius]|uniref:zinc ribbon domain-containing protein n=1 Tax=Ligilactobacillus salivarius TaxID=1624 RepID=UPI001CDAEE44|nr:zinc ribbon domain-containing protein [Ligilactobacillus salivarius]